MITRRATHGLNHGLIAHTGTNLFAQSRLTCERSGSFYGVPGYDRKALDGYDSRGLFGEDRNGTLDPAKMAALPSDIRFPGYLIDLLFPDDPTDSFFTRWYFDVPQNDGWGAKPRPFFSHTVVSSDGQYTESGITYRRWIIDFRHEPGRHVNGEPGEYPLAIPDIAINTPPRARQGIRIIRKVDWDAGNQAAYMSVVVKGYAAGLTGPMRMMNDMGANMNGPSETTDPNAPVQYRHSGPSDLPDANAVRWWTPPPEALMELATSNGVGPYLTMPDPWNLPAKVAFVRRAYALRVAGAPGVITNSNEAWHFGEGAAFQQFHEVRRRANASGRSQEQQHVADNCELFDALADFIPDWDFIYEWQWVNMVGETPNNFFEHVGNRKARLRDFLNYVVGGRTLAARLASRFAASGRPGYISGGPYNGTGMVDFPNPSYVTPAGIRAALDQGQAAFNAYWRDGLLRCLEADILRRAVQAVATLAEVNGEDGRDPESIVWRDYEEAGWNLILTGKSFDGMPFTRSEFITACRAFARSAELGEVTGIMARRLAELGMDSTAFAGPGHVTPARLFDNGSFAMADNPARWRTQHPAMDYQLAAEAWAEGNPVDPPVDPPIDPPAEGGIFVAPVPARTAAHGIRDIAPPAWRSRMDAADEFPHYIDFGGLFGTAQVGSIEAIRLSPAAAAVGLEVINEGARAPTFDGQLVQLWFRVPLAQQGNAAFDGVVSVRVSVKAASDTVPPMKAQRSSFLFLEQK